MRHIRFVTAAAALLALLTSGKPVETPRPVEKYIPAVSFEEADARAREIVARMKLSDKFQLLSGHNEFFIKGLPEYGIPEIYMVDASVGVHLRKNLSEPRDKNGNRLTGDYVMEKSTAFPSLIALASTWNRDLAYAQAQAIGEECRYGNAAVLLGPGMNIYWTPLNGRNFEYFGEDPYLSARMVEQYVTGMQSTGTVATLKHFVCNNTEYKRRISDSKVGDRAFYEIYTPAFRAGIDAGALAVMTSYNKVNGEWTGQNRHLITDVLRGEFGFKHLVMTDWKSIYDAPKAVKSGLNIEMPGIERFPFIILREEAQRAYYNGEITEEEIDRMITGTIRTFIMVGRYDRNGRDLSYADSFGKHCDVALDVAREGCVLLKNDGLLPVRPGNRTVLVTGVYTEKIPSGTGSSEVEGYDRVTLAQAMKEVYGDKVTVTGEATDEQIRKAGVVVVSVGQITAEGSDHSFCLDEAQEESILRAASLNPNVVVLVNSGSGMGMERWNDKVKAVLYGWYPGQNGFRAVAEILSGKTNPSGKLPCTIELKETDRPSYNYVERAAGKDVKYTKPTHFQVPVPEIEYTEGIFVGYRWFEHEGIKPLYPFGYGLSYTTYKYSGLKTPKSAKAGDEVAVEFTVSNRGAAAGKETVQLYVRDNECSVERPEKELKAFHKVSLRPGESKRVRLTLDKAAFSFYDEKSGEWKCEPGTFTILVGGSSADTPLKAEVELL